MKTFDIVNILQDIKATKIQVVNNAKAVGKIINLDGEYKKTKDDEINLDQEDGVNAAQNFSSLLGAGMKSLLDKKKV